MSKQSKKELVPELRFPEFRDSKAWEVKKLGKLGELVSGLTFSPKDVRDKGLLVLRSSNVQNGVVSLEDKVYVRPDVKGVNLSKPNDILICVRNGSKHLIGKNALIPEGLPLCTHGAFMTVFRSKSPMFVFQLFQTSAYERQVEADLGATINSINGNQFKKYEFCVPSLEAEQQKVADCLSSLDELITVHTQIHKALQSYKKGLMQSLFPVEDKTVPALRFPEFLYEEEWVIKPMKKLFEIGNGRDHKHLASGNIPVYGSGGYMRSVNEYLYDGDSACIGRKGTIDKPIFLSGKFWTVDTLFYTHSFKGCLPKFIYLIFQNINWRSHNEAGGVPSLSKANIEKIEIALPRLDEQRKIVDCLSSIDNLITVQTQKSEELKSHKKGLMQQLFPTMEEVGA